MDELRSLKNLKLSVRMSGSGMQLAAQTTRVPALIDEIDNRAALWWPERGGTTRSHSEPGSETLQRRWYWDDRSCESRSSPGICPASSEMKVPGSFFVGGRWQVAGGKEQVAGGKEQAAPSGNKSYGSHGTYSGRLTDAAATRWDARPMVKLRRT